MCDYFKIIYISKSYSLLNLTELDIYSIRTPLKL